MKNSIRYGLIGAFSLMIFSCCLTASAYSPTRTRTGQKQGYTLKSAGMPVAVYAVNADVNVMNVCDGQPALQEPKFSYLLPVNDPKPDNTLVQVWRSQSLKLHKSIMRDC